jgi:hypothetical protein
MFPHFIVVFWNCLGVVTSIPLPSSLKLRLHCNNGSNLLWEVCKRQIKTEQEQQEQTWGRGKLEGVRGANHACNTRQMMSRWIACEKWSRADFSFCYCSSEELRRNTQRRCYRRNYCHSFPLCRISSPNKSHSPPRPPPIHDHKSQDRNSRRQNSFYF